MVKATTENEMAKIEFDKKLISQENKTTNPFCIEKRRFLI
jgi:hypothetical protein